MIKDTEYDRWIKLMRQSLKETRRGEGRRSDRIGTDDRCLVAPDNDPILSLWERLKRVRRA